MPSIGEIALAAAPYVIGGLITVMGLVVFRLSKQRRLLQFLGVDPESRRVIVYLSSLFIPRGCAVGFDGRPRSYQGITIPIEELSISTPLSKAFKIDPFENIPPAIRNALQKKSPTFRPIAVDVNASPMMEQDIDFRSRCIVTIGSQGYNVVSSYCTSHGLTQMQITHDGAVIEVMRGRHKGEIITRPSPEYDIAILERLVDQSSNTTFIIAAGLGVIGTMGAVQYLIDYWPSLHHTFRGNDFALALQFGPVGVQSQQDTLRGVVIRRLPEPSGP